MASTVITHDQLIRLGALSPQSIYNRIIGVNVILAAGPGAGYNFTPNLGSRVWLKGVIVYIDGQREDPEHLHTFELKKGENPPRSAAECSAWEDVISLARTLYTEANYTYQARADFYFPISRLYVGGACRFGLVASAAGGGEHIFTAYWVFTEG